MNGIEVWELVRELLVNRQPVVLLVVAATKGETPAKPGFKMAVADGTSVGTVGGGQAEHDVVEEARAMLHSRDARPHMQRLVHHVSAQADASGMICGGEQTVLIYPCQTDDRAAVDAVIQANARGSEGIIRISASGIAWLAQENDERAIAFDAGSGGAWTYEERICRPAQVFIVGGGHVSLALSRILSMLDFHITVFDDRADVDTMQRNTYAHERIIIPFDRVHERIPRGDRSYVAIMTPSHRADELVLRNVLNGAYCYVGLMASPTKIKEIFTRFTAEGVSPEALSAVHTPIGLPIGSHTPDEIAVSIAAQLIQVRNTTRLPEGGR